MMSRRTLLSGIASSGVLAAFPFRSLVHAQTDPWVTYAQGRIADLDSAISAWTAYPQSVYGMRDANAYASDAYYRAQFDNYGQQEWHRANAYVSALNQERANLVTWLQNYRPPAPRPAPDADCDRSVPSHCDLVRTERPR
jgi:hypothetical protein